MFASSTKHGSSFWRNMDRPSEETDNHKIPVFFRPSPSRLSPGRNTVFVPVERIVQRLASFPLWGIKREHGPIRSPSSPSAMQSPKTRNKQEPKRGHKKKTNKTKTTPEKTNRKNHIIAVDKTALCEFQQLMCWWLSLVCIETTPRTEKFNCKALGKDAKTHSTLRKPGVPPSQEPGDHNATPTGHNRHHNPKQVIMRYLREAMDQQQAPCRSTQCKQKLNEKGYREPKVKRVKKCTPLRVRSCVLLLSSATMGHRLGRNLYVAHSLIALCLTCMTCQGIFGCIAGWHTDVVGPVLQWCQAESRSSCPWPSTPVGVIGGLVGPNEHWFGDVEAHYCQRVGPPGRWWFVGSRAQLLTSKTIVVAWLSVPPCWHGLPVWFASY